MVVCTIENPYSFCHAEYKFLARLSPLLVERTFCVMIPKVVSVQALCFFGISKAQISVALAAAYFRIILDGDATAGFDAVTDKLLRFGYYQSAVVFEVGFHVSNHQANALDTRDAFSMHKTS